jgi:hypothetical protein
MAQWGNRDQASDAPKFVVKAETGETGQDIYGNTTDGVFGVDKDETAAARGDGKGSVPPGWVRKYTRTRDGVTSDVHEVMVAFSSGSITTDATDFANTSTDDVANTTGTADDAEFPDS